MLILLSLRVLLVSLESGSVLAMVRIMSLGILNLGVLVLKLGVCRVLVLERRLLILHVLHTELLIVALQVLLVVALVLLLLHLHQVLVSSHSKGRELSLTLHLLEPLATLILTLGHVLEV